MPKIEEQYVELQRIAGARSMEGYEVDWVLVDHDNGVHVCFICLPDDCDENRDNRYATGTYHSNTHWGELCEIRNFFSDDRYIKWASGGTCQGATSRQIAIAMSKACAHAIRFFPKESRQ